MIQAKMVVCPRTKMSGLAFPELPPRRFDCRSYQSDYSGHEHEYCRCGEAGYEEQYDSSDHGEESSEPHWASVYDHSGNYRSESQQCFEQPKEYGDWRQPTARSRRIAYQGSSNESQQEANNATEFH